METPKEGGAIRIVQIAITLIVFGLLAHTPVQFKNSEPKAAQTKISGQRQNATLTEKPVAETKETVEAQAPEVQPEEVAIPQPLSDKESLMQQAGIPQNEWAATDYIVSHESSWNPSAVNTESGATGLCQALPASKMASVGGDYLSNPVTQLKWCHEYANSRYGSWWSSFAFWQANKWW